MGQSGLELGSLAITFATLYTVLATGRNDGVSSGRQELLLLFLSNFMDHGPIFCARRMCEFAAAVF